MSYHNRNAKDKKLDGKNKDAMPNFFQQCKLAEANAKATASPELGSDQEDDESAAILCELRTFRQENNEKLTAITSAMTSLEQSVEKMGERMTHA